MEEEKKIYGFGFHAKDGWWFNGNQGTVQLVHTDPTGEHVLETVMFDEGTWASIVASVSAGGETGESWQKALAFHTGKRPGE